MKKFLALLVIILSLCTTMTIFAHPGKTDSSGGHIDHSTGEYHYHHGYPEHQHTNDVCPYDYVDASSNNDSIATKDKTGEVLFSILLAIAIFLYLLYWGNKKEK